MAKKYADLSDGRKKTLAVNSNEWLKKNRVGLVSNVRPETRAKFDAIHEKLHQAGLVGNREDTVVYLCDFWNEHEKLSD